MKGFVNLNYFQKPLTTYSACEICDVVLNSRNHYEALMISDNCKYSEIRKQYKQLVLKIHPDKNRSTNANEAFNKVSKAFECLSDPQQREAYNQAIKINSKEDPRILTLIVFVPFALMIFIAFILQSIKEKENLNNFDWD